MQGKNLRDPKGIRNVCAPLVDYKKMDIALTHATSKTRLRLLASNRNALEAVGTRGIEDSPALFSTALTTALLVGEAGAVVTRKPCESYDFGSAEALAATVTTVRNP
jgi:hypothetical protein